MRRPSDTYPRRMWMRQDKEFRLKLEVLAVGMRANDERLQEINVWKKERKWWQKRKVSFDVSWKQERRDVRTHREWSLGRVWMFGDVLLQPKKMIGVVFVHQCVWLCDCVSVSVCVCGVAVCLGQGSWWSVICICSLFHCCVLFLQFSHRGLTVFFSICGIWWGLCDASVSLKKKILNWSIILLMCGEVCVCPRVLCLCVVPCECWCLISLLCLRQPVRARKPRVPNWLRKGRTKLVVLGCEVGGRWSGEAQEFLRGLTEAKARSEPAHLRTTARQAWRAAKAVALPLFKRPGGLRSDGGTPTTCEVIGEARYT